MIGRGQIILQLFFWLVCIFINDYFLIFECFSSQIIQFLILFICVYHQICAMRSFYMGSHISSQVTYTKNKKIEKNVDDYFTPTECKKCGIIRSYRSHHCSICEACIEKMDHHCYFLNRCVGRKNYKYFFSYLFLAFLNSIIMNTIGIYRLYLYKYEINQQKLKFFFILYFQVKIIIILLISLPTTLATGYLIIYHLFLMYKNQTTIERKYPSLYIKDNRKNNRSFKEKFSRMLETNNWLNIYWLD